VARHTGVTRRFLVVPRECEGKTKEREKKLRKNYKNIANSLMVWRVLTVLAQCVKKLGELLVKVTSR
jgi:hypothetical protein